MYKYSYKYCVYLNNCCSGVQFVKAFNRLIDALNYKEDFKKLIEMIPSILARIRKSGSSMKIFFYRPLF